MPAPDTSYTDLPYYAAPIAAAIALAAIPRGVAIGKKLATWYGAMRRARGDARPGAGHFEVEVLPDGDRERTNLGYSAEAKRPGANPTLESEAITLRIVSGPLIRIAAGSKLVVKNVPGAVRRHVDATTTRDGGVKNRFSFELPPGARFWLECELPPAEQGYRDDGVVDVRALTPEFVIFGTQPATPSLTSAAWASALGFAFLGLIAGIMLTMMWRTGCRSGKYAIPSAAFADALSFAAVGSAFGLHVGIGAAIPKALRGRKRP